MNTTDYTYLRNRFLQESYDTPTNPASVARVMMDKRLIKLFISEYNQSMGTNVKFYVRWLRKQRTIMFPESEHSSKPSKFVSVFGLSRRHNLDYLYFHLIRN